MVGNKSVTIKYFVDVIFNIILLIIFRKHDLIFKGKEETIQKRKVQMIESQLPLLNRLLVGASDGF